MEKITIINSKARSGDSYAPDRNENKKEQKILQFYR